MTNIANWKITMLLIGKPSISMGHLYHSYVSLPDGRFRWIMIWFSFTQPWNLNGIKSRRNDKWYWSNLRNRYHQVMSAGFTPPSHWVREVRNHCVPKWALNDAYPPCFLRFFAGETWLSVSTYFNHVQPLLAIKIHEAQPAAMEKQPRTPGEELRPGRRRLTSANMGF